MTQRKRKPKSKLRTWRQKIDTSNALIAGPAHLNEIVYCYQFPSQPNRVKIGYSSRGLARVAEQSTAFPEKPVVLFVIHNKSARSIEAAFHEALAHRQSDTIGTEWFDADMKDILGVSPILRSAAGHGVATTWVKRAATILLAGAGLAFLPITLLLTTSVEAGRAFADVRNATGTYLAQWTSYDVASALDYGLMLTKYSWDLNPSWFSVAVSIIHIPLLCCLPWKRWRRQAA